MVKAGKVSEVYVCEICGKVFKLKHDLLRHMGSHQASNILTHPCPVCHKRLRKEFLPAHQRVHTGEKPFKCDICDKRYRFSHSLRQHRLSHSGERPFACPVCSKAFSQKSLLRLHIRSHTNERPYACDVCGKAFRQRSHLRCHALSHSQPRDHVCAECGKRFTFKQALSLHQRIHKDERPFECTRCGRRFREGPKLTLHLRTHTGERPYTCQVCGRGFAQKGNRDKHANKYHLRDADRKFTCPHCPKAFIWKKCLESHLNWHKRQKQEKREDQQQNDAKVKIKHEDQSKQGKVCVAPQRKSLRKTCTKKRVISPIESSVTTTKTLKNPISKKRNQPKICAYSLPLRRSSRKTLPKNTETQLQEKLNEETRDYLKVGIFRLLPIFLDEDVLFEIGWPVKNIESVVAEVLEFVRQPTSAKKISMKYQSGQVSSNDFESNVTDLLKIINPEKFIGSLSHFQERSLREVVDELLKLYCSSPAALLRINEKDKLLTLE